MKLSNLSRLRKEPEENKFYWQDITLFRDKEAKVNIKRKICAHSPDGFEWGYLGSGPADLALNILYLFLDFPRAWKLHQKFKREIIAGIPRQGASIKSNLIREWIRSNDLKS